MQFINNIHDFLPRHGTCLTIGNFDGVHIGHQALIAYAKARAMSENLDFALMTFWPHPRQVLGRGHMPLCSRAQRAKLLEAMGVKNIFELPFTQELASHTAEDFVKSYLLPLKLRYLAIGHDFSLGKGRNGNAEILAALGKEYGFGVGQLDAVGLEGQPVSSTRLRKFIHEGNVNMAARLLGRYHSIEGDIVHGFGRGKTLGFPTANMKTEQVLLPGAGVYATFAWLDEEKFPAVTNIGNNPTFGGQDMSVETFFLEKSEGAAESFDIYGKPLRLEFVSRLRGEKKFANAEELGMQIEQDVSMARGILAKEK